MKKHASTLPFLAVLSTVSLLSFPAASKDVCSDAYMTAAIQQEAARAQSATGICPTAKAGIALYTKSIRLVNACLHIDSLRSYKVELENLLQQAQDQAAAACS